MVDERKTLTIVQSAAQACGSPSLRCTAARLEYNTPLLLSSETTPHKQEIRIDFTMVSVFLSHTCSSERIDCCREIALLEELTTDKQSLIMTSTRGKSRNGDRRTCRDLCTTVGHFQCFLLSPVAQPCGPQLVCPATASERGAWMSARDYRTCSLDKETSCSSVAYDSRLGVANARGVKLMLILPDDRIG